MKNPAVNIRKDSPFDAQHTWVRISEVARAVGRSKAFVYRRIRDGEISAKRVAGNLRIRFDHAIAYIEGSVESLPEDKEKP